MLMFSLPVENWYRLIAWMVLGLVIYFSYSYKRSHLRLQRETAPAQAGGARRR
jgi:APA family basic amino acid/polyamine antiporter